MKLLSRVLWPLVLSMPAQAAVVCEDGAGLKLTVDERSAQIQVRNANGEVELEQTFPKIDAVWDGHMTGLVTAPGLSVKYEDHYGCIRNVTVTANMRSNPGLIRSVTIPVCRGGSTADELCLKASRL